MRCLTEWVGSLQSQMLALSTRTMWMVVMTSGLLWGCADVPMSPEGVREATPTESIEAGQRVETGVSIWEVTPMGPVSLGLRDLTGSMGEVGRIRMDPATLRAVARARESGADLRVSLSGGTTVTLTPEGDLVRVDFSWPLGDDGSTLVAATYVNGKLEGVQEFQGRVEESEWLPKSMSSLVLPQGERPSTLIQHAFGSRTETVSTSGPQILSDVPEYCHTQIEPTPECEQSCLVQRLAHGAAWVAFMAAEAAVVAAIAGCTMGNIWLCPAVVAAIAGLDGAAYALASTSAALMMCLQEQGQGAPDPTPNCQTVIIEISYDGGFTWQILGTYEVCD